MGKRGDRWVPLFEGLTTSTRFADLPNQDARVFYVMLQLALDDWGRSTADPRKANALVWPLLGMSDKQTAAAIEACRAIGLLEIYPDEGGPFLLNVEHEEKAGRVGKKDHRKASRYPETADLAPLGPEWPELARTGPARPSRAGARASGASASSGASSSLDEGTGEKVEPWVEALAGLPTMSTPEVLAACVAWREHRTAKRHPVWDVKTWARNLRDYADTFDGPARFVAAVEHSCVRNKYQSLVEPKGSSHANGTHVNRPGDRARRPDGTRAGEYAEPNLVSALRVV